MNYRHLADPLPHGDLVFANLLIHHFDRDEAVAILSRMHAAAALGGAVFDLDRNGWAFLLARGILPLFARSAVTVADTLENHERRIIVVDQNGTEHQPTQRMSVSGGKMYLNSVTFPIPVDEVAQVRFMARPFDQFVEFNNASFAAGQKTEPKVEVKDK